MALVPDVYTVSQIPVWSGGISVDFLTAGIEPYNDNAARLVDSIIKHEPEAGIIVVDATGEKQYPPLDYVYHADKRTGGFAEALNIAASLSDADWMVFVNTDTELQSSCAWILANTPPGVYGPAMMSGYGWGQPWLDGWAMAIHRKVWVDVGQWDERFLHGAFEDADYCLRAEAKGWPVAELRLPIIHHEKHSRFANDGFWEQREANRLYLMEKHGL